MTRALVLLCLARHATFRMTMRNDWNLYKNNNHHPKISPLETPILAYARWSDAGVTPVLLNHLAKHPLAKIASPLINHP